MQTIPVVAKRFEQSPFLDCYASPDMVFGVYAGRFYPKSVNENPTEKYWALRCNAAMYDVPEKPVQIEGPDAVPFMEHVFARKIATLKQGRGRYAVACTPGGGLFMDGVVFKLSEGKFWYVQADGALESWLLAHSEGYDITISDPKSRVIQIQGPNSLEILRTASGGGIDQQMGYFHSGYFDLGGQELYVSRTGWTGELGFEIYSQGAQTDHKRLWNLLVEAGAPHGMEFSGAESMGIRRIEAGIVDNGIDIDTSMTPFQAGLGGLIDLDKPDYIGRAALLKADRGTLRYGLKCPSATPARDNEILDNGRIVGSITSGAWSPFLECGIGFVRFKDAGEWVNRDLTIKLQDGGEHHCEIVELPFYDAEKRIARGLDERIPTRP